MDMVAIIKERISELEKKLASHPDPKRIQSQIDANKKLLEQAQPQK